MRPQPVAAATSRARRRASVRVIGIAAAIAAAAAGPGRAASPQGADLAAVRAVAAWAAGGDAHGLPFAIVDKAAARVFLYRGDGSPGGSTPALLGLAHGDLSVPGVGDRPLAAIAPGERTTPAGRFDAALGVNTAGHRILWVDYVAAISLHAVVTSKPAEHRLARLASPTPLDNRISYGCINVPADFFTGAVVPLFESRGGVVYILPEQRQLAELFPAAVSKPVRGR